MTKATPTDRQLARAAAKTQARIAAERAQKPVASITLNIEWKKSRMWGANPHCEAQVRFHDGTFERSPVFKCSGCGYDKGSTVIAQVFNHYLLYKLWALSPEQIKGGHGSGDSGPAPYGISCTDNFRHYAGGIGENCYPAIAAYIGGQWERVAAGKTFDVYRYVDAPAQPVAPRATKG